MISLVHSVAFEGIATRSVEVQVQITAGLPAFSVVGLPDKAVAESKDRVRAAIAAMGLALPADRITVNLSPADLAKEGSHFDLPIALGILAAMELVPAEDLLEQVVLGELGLDGRLMPVSGALPAAIHANSRAMGLICPAAQGPEATWAGDLPILAPETLLQLLNHFKDPSLRRPVRPTPKIAAASYPDLRDVKGQAAAKRALEIAAAGGHNIALIGPPGAGKSLLAKRLPGLMPDLNAREALEVSMIHSVTGMLPEGGLVTRRPFRDPHHSASQPALVGGGSRAKPGEISLAHRGVLFLDELPEFSRQALEALRQPLENGEVTVSRAAAQTTYPARFQLVAAMNLCRCGNTQSLAKPCSRGIRCSEDYLAKISGPFMDRIDLILEMPPVKIGELRAPADGEPSAQVRTRVMAARERQAHRLADHGLETNAEIAGELLDTLLPLSSDNQDLLARMAERFRLTARGYYRLLRVARTIADLEGSDAIERPHLLEASAYRPLLSLDS